MSVWDANIAIVFHNLIRCQVFVPDRKGAKFAKRVSGSSNTHALGWWVVGGWYDDHCTTAHLTKGSFHVNHMLERLFFESQTDTDRKSKGFCVCMRHRGASAFEWVRMCWTVCTHSIANVPNNVQNSKKSVILISVTVHWETPSGRKYISCV